MRSRLWWSIGLLVAAVVAVVLLIKPFDVLPLQHAKTASDVSPARDQARQGAYQAALQAVPVLFSYDYQHLDQDLQAQLGWTTGDFAKAVQAQTQPAVRDLATKYHVVVKAQVEAAAIIDDSNLTTMPVLVFMDQTVTNDQLPAPRIDSNRLRVHMQKVGNDWKVSGVDAI